MPTKKFLQQAKTAAMCMALDDYTHHPLFISCFACYQLVKGLPSDSVAQLVKAWQAGVLPGRRFESLPESLSFFPLFISCLYFSLFSLTLT